jgi:hypothetical protein
MMSLTIELPRPLGEVLASEAQREGISAAEHATILLYLAAALLKEGTPTPFQEAVRSFLAHRSVDAGQIASVLEELVRMCLAAREEETTAVDVASSDTAAEREFTLVRHWRNAIVHALDVSPDAVISHHPPSDAVQQRSGRRQRRSGDGQGATPREQERDPDLVARVKKIRGKFARSGEPLASDALHRERQSDKEQEERQISGHKP